MNDLTVTLIQPPLYWQDPATNRANLEEIIWQIEENTDLIILPEMFTTGFTMEAEQFAEPINFTTTKWLKQLATQMQAVITGSIIIKEASQFFNRLLWVTPDGKIDYYDKRHLFRMANEDKTFQSGNKKIIKQIKGWRICPLICYDLRFPVWSSNIYKEELGRTDYDLLLYVANWPKARITAWDSLLQARAIENLSYVAGVNRIGADGNGIEYNGHSTVINPKGVVIKFLQNKAKVQSVTLSYSELANFREKFPTYMDADRFEIGN